MFDIFRLNGDTSAAINVLMYQLRFSTNVNTDQFQADDSYRTAIYFLP